MEFFPSNTITNFVTRLPHEFRFNGEWVVGLSEIQFPQTFLHVSNEKENNYIAVWSYSETDDKMSTKSESIQTGVYKDINSFLETINNLSNVKNHIKFTLDVGSHITAVRICNQKCATEHSISLSPLLCRIMGFNACLKQENSLIRINDKVRSNHPASLSNALPSVLFVYTDICEPHVTGDVQTPLLRVVPVDVKKYEYGSVRLQAFPVPKYIPLLKANFGTIEIDIRDELGRPMAFDRGVLTVTLHFKRVD